MAAIVECRNCDDFATRDDQLCDRCRREWSTARQRAEAETLAELKECGLTPDDIYEG